MTIVIFMLSLMQPCTYFAFLAPKGPIASGNNVANIVACKHIVGVCHTEASIVLYMTRTCNPHLRMLQCDRATSKTFSVDNIGQLVSSKRAHAFVHTYRPKECLQQHKT